MGDFLEMHAKKFLGDKAWSVDVVLLIGAELAQAVNKLPGLTGDKKAELVCQTVLKMLDSAVKVEKERKEESIEKEKTIAHLEECKKTVTTLLPVTLSLLVAASRGKILLQKAKGGNCLSVLLPCVKGVLSGVEQPVPAKTTETQQSDEKQVQGVQEPPLVVLRTPESSPPPSDENKS
jgi:hypothetical protein